MTPASLASELLTSVRSAIWIRRATRRSNAVSLLTSLPPELLEAICDYVRPGYHPSASES